MEDILIKITPDKEKAKSILKMVNTTLEMIKQINKTKFPSNITKEYYEVIRELIAIIILLDGFKIIGEEAHKRLIGYLKKNYSQFTNYEISIIDDLRILRNKIAYDGFFISKDYLDRKISIFRNIIIKLRKLISEKLS